jgi:MFS family permease
VSSCGDFLAATALVLELQQRGAGGFAVAAVLIAAAAPPVLLVRWTGRLADRVDSRLLLVTTGLAQAAACVALAFASGPVEIIALVSVLAAGLAVTQPCLSALLPSMVPADDLPKAMALSQTAGSLGLMLAPALGGLLMGRFGLRLPLLADAGSYLAIAAAGRLIRTRRGVTSRPVQRTRGEADREVRDEDRGEAAARTRGAGNETGSRTPGGWGVRRDPLVRAAVVLVGAVVAAASLVNVAEVFFIRATLHSTASAYGLMDSVWVSASVAGGWWVARRRPSEARVARLLLASLTLTCLGVALMATVPAVGWLAPVSVLGGLGNGGVNVAAAVLLGRRVPAAMRGRAFAVFGAVANGANVAGLLLGGVLLAVVPVRAIIAAAGLGGLAATAAFALPVLRATARERAVARKPDRANEPDQPPGRPPEVDDRTDGTGQVSAAPARRGRQSRAAVTMTGCRCEPSISTCICPPPTGWTSAWRATSRRPRPTSGRRCSGSRWRNWPPATATCGSRRSCWPGTPRRPRAGPGSPTRPWPRPSTSTRTPSPGWVRWTRARARRPWPR